MLNVTTITNSATKASLDAQPAAAPTQIHKSWEAHLRCDFELVSSKTVLARRDHRGPLLVQRPFYPEGPETCHLYVVHPPGGVAGGDRLNFAAHLHPKSHALITTPAATKLYRSNAIAAHAESKLHVYDSSCLEWLPQETIVFSGAHAELKTRVHLASAAQFMGWEIMSLGRTARGESFAHGCLRQAFEIYRDGKPVFVERTRLEGDDEALHQAWGLSGNSTFGTFVCITDHAAQLTSRLREELRCDAPGRFSVTALSAGLVCRYIGPWAEGARAYFTTAWHLLRPWCLNKPAIAPRIWAT